MQTVTQERSHMKLPTMCALSNLTALTELSLTDTHNRHSLLGLQHLSSLSHLRYGLTGMQHSAVWHGVAGVA